MRPFLGTDAVAPSRLARAALAFAIGCLAAGGSAATESRGSPADRDTSEEPFSVLEPLERAMLVRAVLERNPQVAAARAALSAAEARAEVAAGLDALSIRSGLAPLSVGSSAVDLGYELEAMQMLPFPGRRRLRRDVAAAQAEGADAEIAALRLALAQAASDRYDDYYLVQRALEITAEHVALLEDLFQVATARYAAGLASQQDPLQAEVELAHLHHDQVVLGSEEEAVRAEINALLHRDTVASLPATPPTLPLPANAELDEERLLDLALASRPELDSARAEIRAREAELELARLGGRPDFGVSAGYSTMWGDDEHRLMIGGTLSWPVWRKRVNAAVVEAAAGLDQAEASQQALLDQVRRDVHVAITRLREAHHVVEIYASRMLPPARDQVRAARAGFENGRNDFVALIGAARGLRSLELRYHEALAGYYRQHAALERAVAAPVATIDADRVHALDAPSLPHAAPPEGAEP